MKQCRICGKIFEPATSNKQLCSDECVQESMRRNIKKHQELKKQKNRERLGTKNCLECGKEFVPRTGRQVCCGSVCQKARTQRMALTWRLNQEARERAKKAEKKKRKRKSTLADINTKAREAGMTYGRYVAYMTWKENQK